MFSALRNIAFAPFALLVEKWRWDVYSGKSTPNTYNTDWWRLRCEYQGLVPPVPRAKGDFDPGSKYVNDKNIFNSFYLRMNQNKTRRSLIFRKKFIDTRQYHFQV